MYRSQSKPQSHYCWFLASCVSFVLGFSLASFRFAGESCAWTQALDLLNTPASTTSTRGPSETKSDTHQNWQELFDYVYDLIDTTVGVELWRAPNVTGDALRQRFRESLVNAMGAEPCNCGNIQVGRRRTQEQKVDSPPEVLYEKIHEVQQVEVQFKRRFPDSVKYLNGMGRVDRTDFSTIIDTGVPLHLSDPKRRDVLIVYGHASTLPDDPNVTTHAVHAGTSNIIPAELAIQNCQQLSVIHLKPTKDKNCWAFVPGQESFHLQKWLRVSPAKDASVSSEVPFRLVARGYDRSGEAYPQVPTVVQSKTHRKWLGEYFLHVDSLLAELNPIIERIAVNNRVVFTVVNAGQSSLLLNFVCSAENRGLDISRILVFVLDEKSRDLVEGLGMVAFYDPKFFGALQSSSGNYASKTFASVVTAKLMRAHLLSLTRYDFLAQDVDVIWYKDPLTFFDDHNVSQDFDIYFQG